MTWGPFVPVPNHILSSLAPSSARMSGKRDEIYAKRKKGPWWAGERK